MVPNSNLKSAFYQFLVDFCHFVVNLTKKTILTQKVKKKNQCPKMVSKQLYGHYLTSYEQFYVFQKATYLLV